MKTFNLKRLAAAVALLGAGQATHALEIAAFGGSNPDPTKSFFISGGAAQDLAFSQVVLNSLAKPGTLTIYTEATSAGSTTLGSGWTAYYFTGADGSPGEPAALGGGLAGQPVLIVKRSLGAAGYGVLPLIASDPANAGGPVLLDELNIAGITAADVAAGKVTTEAAPTGLAGVQSYHRVILGTAADAAFRSAVIVKVPSNAGILGVDSKLLLKPGTQNYPTNLATQRNVLGTNTGETSFASLPKLSAVPGGFTRVYTGGQVHGVAVTTDFYKLLQAAQVLSGSLPSSTAIGNYADAAQIPSLSKSFIASVLRANAGSLSNWNQVKIVTTAAGVAAAKAASADPAVAALNNAGGQVLSITDPAVAAYAGVSLGVSGALPAYDTSVEVVGRNPGAAIGAVANAVFLGAPWTNGAYSLPQSQLTLSAPFYHQADGTNQTDNALDDFNQATNTSTKNAGLKRRFAIGFTTADRNASGTAGVTPEAAGKKHHRFVKIDGYLPTLQNIAAGKYSDWVEGELIYNPTASLIGANTAVQANDHSTGSGAEAVFKALAGGLSSPAVAADANATVIHTWSVPNKATTGIFTKPSTGVNQSFPWADSNPVIPYTHLNGQILDEITPVSTNPAQGLLLP